jgi:hypothetical protein
MPEMTLDQFGQKIKAKYPAYAKLSDSDVATKFLAKFPVYKSQVQGGSDAAALEKKAMDPNASYKPTTVSTGQVAPESGIGKFMSGAVKAASPILATVGALGGGAVAGPPGAMAGAAVGGAAGKAIETRAETGKVNAGKTYDAGVGQGLLEGVGGPLMSKALGAMGKAAEAGIDSSMAKLLGLKFAKNPRLGRATAEQIEKIANVVNQHVGGAATLPRLAEKISAVKEAMNQTTEHLIQNTPGARLVPFDTIVTDTAIKAQDIARATGREGYVKPIDELYDVLLKKLPSNAQPKDILELRRTLLKESDNSGQAVWPAGTKKFRLMLYHDLNDAIGKALPPEQAAKFASNNANVSKLIMAEDAVKERLAKRVTGQEGRKTAGEYAMGIAKAGALPALGATEGYRETHSLKGALIGGAIGYGGSRVLGSTATKSAGIGLKKIGAAVLPALSKAARMSPAAARALQTISDIRSQPNQ